MSKKGSVSRDSSVSSLPIHGFDEGRARYASAPTVADLLEPDINVSPIKAANTRPVTRRSGVPLQPPVDLPLRRRRLVSSLSVSSSEPYPVSRTSSIASLGWDDYTGGLPVNSGLSVNTHFNVAVGDETAAPPLPDDAVGVLSQLRESDSDSSADIFEDPERFVSPAVSLLTVVPNVNDNMDAEDLLSLPMWTDADLNKHIKNLKKVTCIWTDDYEGVDPSRLTDQRLKSRAVRAEELKDLLTDAIIELDASGYEHWTRDIKDQAKNLKKLLVQFVKRADDRQYELQNERPKDPVAEAKAKRVTKHKDDVIYDMSTLQSEVESLAQVKPDSEPSFLLHHERVQETRERVKTAISEATDLCKDATEAALPAEAEALDDAVRILRKSDANLASDVLNTKSAIGVINIHGRVQTTDVPVPKFSGAPADKDYYSFIRDWERYIRSRPLSEPEKHRVLTLNCLTGNARTVSEPYETVPEILEHLKTIYGNPRYLFDVKAQEIRKLSKREGSDVKRREWTVEARSKMQALEKLAITHKLQEKLFSSNIVGDIQAFFDWRTVNKFKKAVKAADSTGNLSGEEYWRQMVNFLNQEITDLTFDINYALNTGSSVVEKPKEVIKKPAAKAYATDGAASNPTASTAASAATPAAAPDSKARKKPKNKKSGQSFVNTNVNISAVYVEPAPVSCVHCNGSHTHIFACKKFQEAREKDRIAVAAKMKVCFRCLRMDSAIDMKNRESWWCAHEPNCVTTWVCTYDKCPKLEKKRQFHMLMCTHHVEQNKENQRAFINDMDQKIVYPGLSFFFHDTVQQYNVTVATKNTDPDVINDITYPTIFLLQEVERKGERLLLFYDGGCSTAALSDKAARVLESVETRPGPTTLHCAGAVKVELETGDESFNLQLEGSEKSATITGLRMPTCTNEFPVWDIQAAWQQILAELDGEVPDHDPLPPAPEKIGGRCVDIMIGVRYHRYFPKLMYYLPSGLGIFKSQFAAYKNQTCVLGGPHKSWEKCKYAANFMSPHEFLSKEMRAYNFACQTISHVYSPAETICYTPDVEQGVEVEGDEDDGEGYEQVFVLDQDLPEGISQWEAAHDYLAGIDQVTQVEVCSNDHCERHTDGAWHIPADWSLNHSIYGIREDTTRYLEGELSASEISYRCVRCRNCNSCRNSTLLESASLREETEQALIENCVVFDPEKKTLTSKLPFISDPAKNLLPNRYTAEKIFSSQLKKANVSEEMKEDVLAGFNKLADKGYLTPVSSLPEKVKNQIEDPGNPGHFIPWRVVWKESSLSTPVRMVFDASSRTPGGLSLNEVLAKGENRLANIHNILLNFRSKAAAFTSDIKMAYNQIALDEEHLCYQKFLWKKELDPISPTEPYVIKTLIYGVKPVGNSLLAGFSKVSEYCMSKYPEHQRGAHALANSSYVDDVARSEDTLDEAKSTASSLDFTLGLAGMAVKGYTFSGQDPPPEVSANGESIGLVGMVWHSKKDQLALEIKPLFFGKSVRGKLPKFVNGDIESSLKDNFTRRNMLSKVAGVFDPLGLITPITSRFKLDLHEIVELRQDWDTPVPEDYLQKWVKNLSDIQDLREVRFRRTIVPEDAANLDVELIISCDASQSIAVSVVHARMKRKNGEYSCQLVSAKSKLCRELTIPKAELRAMVLSCHLAHSAKQSFGERLAGSTYVSDSTIALFWLHQDHRPLEVAVRNCVIEVRRFSSPSQWYHIESAENIADLPTREAAISDIGWNSEWQTGKAWMRNPRESMPIKTVDEIKLSQEEQRLASQELKSNNVQGIVLPMLATRVADRMAKVNYLVDPNKYSWIRSVRVMAIILKYLRIRVKKFEPDWWPKKSPIDGNETVYCVRDKAVLSRHDINVGQKYYFHLATQEVEHFVPKNLLKDTDKQNGILYFVGRILDGQEINAPVDTFFDLPPLHFVQPIVERFSPLAYAIMTHAHTSDSIHKNVAATLRASREIAYILKGRDLAIEIREACFKCRRFRARLTKVEMGRMHDSRLTIAPPFFHAQVDLFGPLTASCEHNHRSSVKIWGVVFKDPTCAAVSVYTMAKYDVDAFVSAFTRFTSVHGCPKKLFIDEGSQLKAACTSMDIPITDLTNQLFTKFEVGVEFVTCPVGGHNAHGLVERSIRTIQDLFKQVYAGLKLDILAYETAFAYISSQLNSLPICLGSRTDNLDNLDLITPARLLIGRLSTRAIAGYPRVEPPSRVLQQLDSVYKCWWDVWQKEKLAEYIPQPNKWKETNVELKVGDIVMILRNPDEVQLGGPIWRIARVFSVEQSHKDAQVRTVICQYKNANEKVYRYTRRSARKIAVIHHETELDFVDRLNHSSFVSNVSFYSSDYS